MKKIEEFHKHIDNGGITLSINETVDEYRQLVIKLETGYFGYPNIETKLMGWGQISSIDLEKIGFIFLSASQKYKITEEELKER